MSGQSAEELLSPREVPAEQVCGIKQAGETIEECIRKNMPVVIVGDYDADGNNALSTGGTGDVLTGMIAGLLAQGMRPKRAAVLAVCLHGIAADEYVRDRGGRYSMIASDLLDMLPQILPK